ncbi:large ribosomal subunit protein mL55 [Euwallacea fornicatus]|uniref:large ribosomal subunit protein mL55 n=1 Tax=Euwallacea fornicatus TaxID=995702 RepID=UPI00338E84CA
MNTKFYQFRRLSCWTASITRPHRFTYLQFYPTLLVQPDGSTYTIRYPEPRKIIKLPINIWTLSEAERKSRLEKRKPKTKMVFEDDVEDSFDSKKYLKYLKK